MPRNHTYRCYLLDAQRHIGRVEIIDCLDDDDARLRAHEILAARPDFCGIEVWEFDRRVPIRPADADAFSTPSSETERWGTASS
jgi:hypothetical protein